jgi:polysaccharide export outer membrane protein
LYRYLFLTLLALLFLLSGCGSKNILADSYIVKERDAHQKKYHSKRNYFPGRFEYRIQPHDRVGVSVYNHPELGSNSGTANSKDNGGVLIDSGGNVILPLLNTVHLGGLTQPQASRKLTRLYNKYLKRSSVRVETLSKRAFVVGEVKNPGVVPLPNEQIALLQAISVRGGFTDTANHEKIVVLRRVNKGTRADVVDLTNLTSLSYAGMMIRPGDVIYVAPTAMKNFEVNILPIFKAASAIISPFAYYKALVK